jgi:hypothetical protein
MPRTEINWRRRSPDGEPVQVRANQIGDQWHFFIRGARYDQWQPHATPPLEDWLALLDGLRRRQGRGAVRAADVTRLERSIRERFPDAEI